MINGSGPKKKYIKKLEEYRRELVAADNQLSSQRLKIVTAKVNKYIRLLGYEGKGTVTPMP